MRLRAGTCLFPAPRSEIRVWSFGTVYSMLGSAGRKAQEPWVFSYLTIWVGCLVCGERYMCICDIADIGGL
jgi:hypothetical protein